ncbi:MAG: aminotransferase class I/II-fold pyridoxal phosphate-dependent enzyme, partial [Betaproteobacteria bacterium]
GVSFNFAALRVLPVLMAGVLMSRVRALGTTAAVTLLLLLTAWRGGGDSPTVMLQSGLAGMGLFVIALLASELAGRLSREELAARESLELARQQAQLNRLVIEEMADGVLVVDRALQVRAANPAARALLVDQGLSPPAPFALDRLPAWATLWQAAQQALASGQWPEAGQDVVLAFGQGHTRTLRLRVRFMRPRGVEVASSEPAAVLLLEDLRTLQARIRQEKLAAMGRVSAGIAHEIRNPLAAIAQANALLLEDPLQPAQQQLAAIVADNVQRLKRLVDDVMEVAPGAVSPPQAMDAATAVAQAAADWARTQGLPMGPPSALRAELHPAPLGVAFDPEHLRRVLVNLLDNALRHASGEPGSVFLRLTPQGEATVMLSVLSDGPPIAPEVERRLFEPFSSTRSRGTGLGLYICRELCERHGASIEYQPLPAAERLRNEFTVRMRRIPLSGTAPAPPLPLAAHIHSARVLSLGSFSKICAPGLRLGWIHGTPAVLHALTQSGVVQSGGGLNPYVSGVMRSMIGLGLADTCLDALRVVYAARSAALYHALRTLMPTVAFVEPLGGYFVWVQLPAQLSAAALLPLARAEGVTFPPGARFISRDGFAHALRLSFAHYDTPQLEEGVQRLARAMAHAMESVATSG